MSHSLRPFPAVALTLVVALCSSFQEAAPPPAVDFELDSFSKQLREVARWKGDREEALLADLVRSVAECGAPQAQLVADLLCAAPDDLEGLPLLEPTPAFDPEVYPPGKTRRPVKPSSSKWKKLAESLVDEGQARTLPRRYGYDFVSGELRLVDAELAEERRLPRALRSALLGFPPDQDLAEALLIQRLDRARPHAELAAFFSHDYADLKAQSYVGISLFDVWSHQIPLDVPDVDLRAFAKVVHGTVLPEKLRDSTRQDWYQRMSASLGLLRDHRRGAEATAAYWVQGAPNLANGWTVPRNAMQALAASMEDVDEWVATFEEHGDEIAEFALATTLAGGNDAWDPGNERRDGLVRGRAQIRAAAAAALARALD